jgi:uncharacterized membrane protein
MEYIILTKYITAPVIITSANMKAESLLDIFLVSVMALGMSVIILGIYGILLWLWERRK